MLFLVYSILLTQTLAVVILRMITTRVMYIITSLFLGRQEAETENLSLDVVMDKMTTARVMSLIYSIIRRQTSDVSGI